MEQGGINSCQELTQGPYTSKYGAIFAQLATREHMERERVREVKDLEKDGREKENEEK